MNQRIVLIHATPLAVEPINQAFAGQWPQAAISNLLDDALSVDRRRVKALDERLYKRIDNLVEYAVSIEAAAILFTCSAFGDAIERSAQSRTLPILKPNEAMFESALTHGRHIVMLATFEPAVAGMEQEFSQMARAVQPQARLESLVVPGAREALEQGDAARHHRLIAEAAKQFDGADAIVLAHFSMAGALSEVQAAVRCPVLSSPQAAVSKLQKLMS